MKWIPLFTALTVVAILHSNGQAQVTKTLISNGAVHDAVLQGTVVNGADYYGRGNDDTNAIDGEYGIATFNYTPADFGAASISDITQFDYTLTHSTQDFSDGAEFVLWLTTDDFDANYTGLSYNTSLFAGLNTSEYSNLSLLGMFPYTAPPASATGDQEVISIPLSATQQSEILNEINSSSDFSIIITAVEDADDVTFTGLNDVFAPGGRPALTINSTSSTAVPEPTAIGFLALVGLAGLTRRRR